MSRRDSRAHLDEGTDEAREEEDGSSPKSEALLRAVRLTAAGWGAGWGLEPAPKRRDWMDALPHAYRCLPLVIANQWGWQVTCPVDLEVTWDGSADPSGLVVAVQAPYDGVIKSQFGSGIVTFSPPWSFQTAAGWDLLVKGPTNSWKQNAIALEGIVETWWLQYTFTVNWKLVEPGSVTFAAGEPIAQLIPLPHGTFDGARAEEFPLDEAPEVRAELRRWQEARVARASLAEKNHYLYRDAGGTAGHTKAVRVPGVTKGRRG